MTTQHHHHHQKAAEDAQEKADTPQSGGSATTDTSTNAASDQVGTQEPAAETPAVEVQANDRESAPVGQGAEQAPAGDSDNDPELF
jgi:hypothetical protein